jgi:hypothetical protein
MHCLTLPHTQESLGILNQQLARKQYTRMVNTACMTERYRPDGLESIEWLLMVKLALVKGTHPVHLLQRTMRTMHEESVLTIVSEKMSIVDQAFLLPTLDRPAQHTIGIWLLRRLLISRQPVDQETLQYILCLPDARDILRYQDAFLLRTWLDIVVIPDNLRELVRPFTAQQVQPGNWQLAPVIDPEYYHVILTVVLLLIVGYMYTSLFYTR